jgi:hypothetical protein
MDIDALRCRARIQRVFPKPGFRQKWQINSLSVAIMSTHRISILIETNVSEDLGYGSALSGKPWITRLPFILRLFGFRSLIHHCNSTTVQLGASLCLINCRLRILKESRTSTLSPSLHLLCHVVDKIGLLDYSLSSVLHKFANAWRNILIVTRVFVLIWIVAFTGNLNDSLLIVPNYSDAFNASVKLPLGLISHALLGVFRKVLIPGCQLPPKGFFSTRFTRFFDHYNDNNMKEILCNNRFRYTKASRYETNIL